MVITKNILTCIYIIFISSFEYIYFQGVKSGNCKHVYCASGGNAGMAAAHASKQLGVPCTIIVPQTTPEFMHHKLHNLVSISLVNYCLARLPTIWKKKKNVLNLYKTPRVKREKVLHESFILQCIGWHISAPL